MEALEYLFLVLPFAIVIVLAVSIVLVVIVLHRDFTAGCFGVVITMVMNAVWLGSGGFQLGITWYLPDVVFILLMFATVARLLFAADARLGVFAYYVLCGVVALNLAQGLLQLGSAAGVSVRPTFYALVAMAYALSFSLSTEHLRGMARAIAAGGLILLVLAAFRAAVTALDIREWLPPSGSFQPQGHSVWRVIVSSETLLLAQLAMVFWFHRHLLPNLGALRVLTPVMLLAVVGLQHRSVWLALLVALLAVQVARARTAGLGTRIGPLLLLVVALGMGAMLAGGDAKLGGDIGKSARDAVELRGTAGERLGSWQQLIQNWVASGPRGLAIGNPFGTSIERYVSEELGARKIEYQPHNYYVELLVGQGLVGFGAWLALYSKVVRGLWRARTESVLRGESEFLLMLVAAQMAYYLTYGVDYVQALFLGAALSWVRTRSGDLWQGGIPVQGLKTKPARA